MLHISGFPLPIKKLRMQDMMQYLTGKQIFVCLQLKMCTTVAKFSHPEQEHLMWPAASVSWLASEHALFARIVSLPSHCVGRFLVTKHCLCIMHQHCRTPIGQQLAISCLAKLAA